MSQRSTLRAENRDGVFHIVLSRADEYNTITPALRDELSAALGEADADPDAHVILLRAEEPAFCAGYGLDWAVDLEGGLAAPGEGWDSVQDLRGLSTFVDVYMKVCNQTAENMGLASSRLLGTLFDGIARHTREGLAFAARAREAGWRQAVRERDDPFGDYGSRPQE